MISMDGKSIFRRKSVLIKKEVENYYYRFGVLIFINYILNVNDLHGENVIAAGEYPVIIDAETILDNVKYLSEKNARLTISSYIHESVLYSGLLPYYRFARKGKPVNMGAINGTEGEEYPILVPVVKEPWNFKHALWFMFIQLHMQIII